MDLLDNLMFLDETMDFIKEEIKEKIDIDDIFLSSSSPAINGEEPQRLDDNIPYLHFMPIVLVLLHESIPLFNLSAVSSAESAPLYEPEVQGPGGEEKLGILQTIEILDKIADTLLSRYISPLSPIR